MTRFYTYFTILLSLILSTTYAQDIDPLIVLDSAQNKLERVVAYTADATIDLDVDFLKMPAKEVKISYEYPNKMEVDAKGFLMIPKYGLKPIMKNINDEDNMVIFAGRELIDGVSCYIIKLLPRSDGKLIMIKMWIRTTDYLVARTETFTRRSGSFLIDFQYQGLILPSTMVFSFESRGMNIPWKFIGSSIEIDKAKMKEDELNIGKVNISFSNYKIQYK